MASSRDPVPTLVAHGAPLLVEPRREMELAAAVLLALGLLGEDPSLPLALPVVLVKNAGRLDWDGLLERARQVGLGAELGMMLDVAGETAPSKDLGALARRLDDTRRAEPTYLPPPRSRWDRQLADHKTPAAMRRWGFRANLSEDHLVAFMRKHLRDFQVVAS